MKELTIRNVFIVFCYILLFFVGVAVVQWLWNDIIPWIIGFPPMTYWQAAGLLILCRILFSGWASCRWIGNIFRGDTNCSQQVGELQGGYDHNYVHEKLRSMTPEQRREYIRMLNDRF